MTNRSAWDNANNANSFGSSKRAVLVAASRHSKFHSLTYRSRIPVRCARTNDFNNSKDEEVILKASTGTPTLLGALSSFLVGQGFDNMGICPQRHG